MTKGRKPSWIKVQNKPHVLLGRSSTNFDTTTTNRAMVVPNRTHCRTQSAVSPNIGEVAASSRAAVRTLAGSASAASLLQVHRSPSHQQGVFTKMDKWVGSCTMLEDEHDISFFHFQFVSLIRKIYYQTPDKAQSI